MNNQELEIILSKIEDLREFQIQRHNDLMEDLRELKESDKEQIAAADKAAAKLEEYSENHYKYHKRERKTLWRWIIIIFIVTIIIGAAGLGEVIVPYALSLLRFLPI